MQTIFITGGTGLISSAQVKYFVSKGYRVIVTYRNESKFADMKSDNLIGIKISELLDDHVADEICLELDKRDLYPEVLINNACDTKWHRIEPSGVVSRECFLNQYKINVILPYELSIRMANMRGTQLKKIINISSMYGIVPYNPHLYADPEHQTPLQYSLSKCALIHLTKELAVRFRDRGIVVNCVSYGGVDGRVDDAFKQRFAELTPLKRMMSPEETISAVEFLINDQSGYMTGHNLVVDGGRTIW